MKFVITQKQSEHSDFPEEDYHIGGYKTEALRLVWSRVCSMFSGTDKGCSFFPSADDFMWIMPTANKLEYLKQKGSL